MKLNLNLIPILGSFLASTACFAQGAGHVGGGNITEADLQNYINKIDTYLLSEEGLIAFPEIVEYNATHPNQSFHELVKNVHPVVKNTELKDSFGEVRDCVSYANPGNRYFVCNSSALPNKTLDNQPSFYRIVFHELLIQAGLEKPISREIPSAYPISSRITDNVHLETYQEWVPGKLVEEKPHYSETTYFQCTVPELDLQFETRIMRSQNEADLTIYEHGKRWVESTEKEENLKKGDFQMIDPWNFESYNYRSGYEDRYGFNSGINYRRMTEDANGDADYKKTSSEEIYMQLDLDFKKDSFVSDDQCYGWVKGKFQISKDGFLAANHKGYHDYENQLKKHLTSHTAYCTIPMYKGVRHRFRDGSLNCDFKKPFTNRISDGTFNQWSLSLMKQYLRNSRKRD